MAEPTRSMNGCNILCAGLAGRRTEPARCAPAPAPPALPPGRERFANSSPSPVQGEADGKMAEPARSMNECSTPYAGLAGTRTEPARRAKPLILPPGRQCFANSSPSTGRGEQQVDGKMAEPSRSESGCGAPTKELAGTRAEPARCAEAPALPARRQRFASCEASPLSGAAESETMAEPKRCNDNSTLPLTPRVGHSCETVTTLSIGSCGSVSSPTRGIVEPKLPVTESATPSCDTFSLPASVEGPVADPGRFRDNLLLGTAGVSSEDE
mmetsp:Transcript_61037/g.162048  ORF Transcript_61037/g.162048 Transcript_61037/m.162048 type:complete len:269 (-) Transcript_61037:1154-1960(-)